MKRPDLSWHGHDEASCIHPGVFAPSPESLAFWQGFGWWRDSDAGVLASRRMSRCPSCDTLVPWRDL